MVDVLIKVRLVQRSRELCLNYIAGDEFNRQRHESQTQQLQPCQRFPHPDATKKDVRSIPSHPLRAHPSMITCRGNLSVRSLADIVQKEHFVGDSEYMQTVLVAVPKCVSSYARRVPNVEFAYG